MMINTGTDAEKEATWKFLSYLASPQELAGFAVTTGYMAGRRSARATSLYQEYVRRQPHAAVTYEQLEHGHPRPQVPFWNTIQADLISQLSPAMYTKNANFRPVLSDIVSRADALLQEWKAGR